MLELAPSGRSTVVKYKLFLVPVFASAARQSLWVYGWGMRLPRRCAPRNDAETLRFWGKTTERSADIEQSFAPTN